jgi:hypothetical protein
MPRTRYARAVDRACPAVGYGGVLQLQTLDLLDGTIVGIGAGGVHENPFAIVGGTGRYAGLRGTYVARQSPREHGGDGTAEFGGGVRDRGALQDRDAGRHEGAEWVGDEVAIRLTDGLRFNVGLNPGMLRLVVALASARPLGEVLDEVAEQLDVDPAAMRQKGPDLVRGVIGLGFLSLVEVP